MEARWSMNNGASRRSMWLHQTSPGWEPATCLRSMTNACANGWKADGSLRFHVPMGARTVGTRNTSSPVILVAAELTVSQPSITGHPNWSGINFLMEETIGLYWFFWATFISVTMQWYVQRAECFSTEDSLRARFLWVWELVQVIGNRSTQIESTEFRVFPPWAWMLEFGHLCSIRKHSGRKEGWQGQGRARKPGAQRVKQKLGCTCEYHIWGYILKNQKSGLKWRLLNEVYSSFNKKRAKG